MITKLQMNKVFLEGLETYSRIKIEQGFIPTIEGLIEEIKSDIAKEEELINEANRLNQHND